jgi:hypothetical protein
MRRTAAGTAFFAAVLLMSTTAFANTYIIHLSGMCSKDWTGGSGLTPGGPGSSSNGGIKGLANAWAGTMINAQVDQTQGSLSVASSQLVGILNTYCTGSNSCWIYNYSAGDLVLGYTFAHSATSWNVTSVRTAAGAAGGSNLAGTIASAVACSFANNLTESASRNAYTHDWGYNTGTTIYRTGGHKQMTISNVACVVGSVINFLSFGLVSGGTCLESHNDGAVAYQSSGGYQNTGDYQNFWLSSDPSGSHWYSHASYWVTGSNDVGDNLNHYNEKGWLICMDGGFSGLSGYTNCFNWAATQ